MKKILIISYYYAPANMMGAVRATKLSKYLQRRGYEVDVICSEKNNLMYIPGNILSDEKLAFDTEKVNKIVVKHSKLYSYLALFIKRILTKKEKDKDINNTVLKKDNRVDVKIRKKNTLKKIIHFFSYCMSVLQDIDFYFQAKKVSCKDISNYSVVISTYGPTGSHFVGAGIKKINPKTLWIADFRDPIAQPSNGRLEFILNKGVEKYVIKKSDIITAVSKGYLAEILKETHKRSYVITNGYDRDDIKIESQKLIKNKLSFVYTGTTYAGKRDLGPIFNAIRELINENKIDVEKIEFLYAGPEENIIYDIGIKTNLLEIIKSYGLVSRTESLNIQNSSDILCVATWNVKGHTGVLPGKFLEYLYFNKPIISIVTGEVGNSEISNIIEKDNLGFAFEAVKEDIDFINLKKYILACYQTKIITQNELKLAPNNSINKYNYEKITDDFIRIMED